MKMVGVDFLLGIEGTPCKHILCIIQGVHALHW